MLWGGVQDRSSALSPHAPCATFLCALGSARAMKQGIIGVSNVAWITASASRVIVRRTSIATLGLAVRSCHFAADKKAWVFPLHVGEIGPL